MTRPTRINLPYALYHAMSRTNSGDVAFPGARDLERFLWYLKKYAGIFQFRIHA